MTATTNEGIPEYPHELDEVGQCKLCGKAGSLTRVDKTCEVKQSLGGHDIRVLPPDSPPWFTKVRPEKIPDEVFIPKNRRVQLVVLRSDGTYRYYAMEKYPGGWHIDATYRTLVIGKGMGRIIIPLETIDYFSPQEY